MPELSKPQRLTLSTQILRQMEQCILHNVWAIGEKIPGELELMAQFGVSRNTVREAVQSLAYAGVLQTRPGDGTYVLCRDKFDAALQTRLRDARLSEILETRLVLETDIVRLASLRRQEQEVAALAAMLAQRDAPDLEKREFVQADSAYHLKVAELCHNCLLFDLYRSLLAFLEELVEAYLFSSGFDRQLAEHQALYRAIASQNADEAARIVHCLVLSERETFTRAGIIHAQQTQQNKKEESDHAYPE